jgi:hypothetical protein
MLKLKQQRDELIRQLRKTDILEEQKVIKETIDYLEEKMSTITDKKV